MIQAHKHLVKRRPRLWLLRPALLHDLDVLGRPAGVLGDGRAHAAAWQDTYKGVIPDEVLATFTAERRTRMWERVIARPREAREHIAVAEVDGVVVGFAWTSACRDEGSPDSLGELQAINVDPGHIGTGVAATCRT